MTVRRTVRIRHDELLLSHDPERIFGYCSSCKHHGKLWTCPPHEVDPLMILGDFSEAVLYRWLVPYQSDEKLAIFNKARQEMAGAMVAEAREGEAILIAGECFACERCTRSKGLPCVKPEERHYSLESLGFDVQRMLEKHFGEALLFPGDPDFQGYTLVGARIIKP